MTSPNYIIVKLDDPVGPEDAQDLARHMADELDFVESAQPAAYDGLHAMRPVIARFRLCGEEAKS